MLSIGVSARHAVARLAAGLAMAGGFGMAPASLRADSRVMYDSGASGIGSRYLAHAEAARIEGRMTEGLEACDRAIADQPAFMAAHLHRGLMLMDIGLNDTAINEFTTALAAHPDSANLYYFRGIAYLRQHRASDAVAQLNRAASAPGILSGLYSNVLAVRSLAWEMLGKADLAVADMGHASKVLTNDPENTYIMLYERCNTATIVGLLHSASDSCDGSIALRADADNEAAYESRGLLDLKLGNWDRAIADYTKALYYRPELTQAFYGRSIARRAKGDVVAANADAANGQKGEPHIAEIMSRLGVSAIMITKPK